MSSTMAKKSQRDPPPRHDPGFRVLAFSGNVELIQYPLADLATSIGPPCRYLTRFENSAAHCSHLQMPHPSPMRTANAPLVDDTHKIPPLFR